MKLQTFRPRYLAAIGWFIISTILLTLPGSAFPTENWFSLIWFDKWVHIGMFSIMVVLWCWAKKNDTEERSKKRIFMMIALVWLCYGIIMEFVQQRFIPNRSFDLGDIVADAIGCLVGLWFSTKRYIKK